MVSAENEGWMSIRVYRNKRRRRGRGGGDQKGSARKQRTKVGEFPLGRDKEEMRRQRGRDWKEKESRGRSRERWSRLPVVVSWRYSRTNWIYELARRTGRRRSLGQVQRTLPLVHGRSLPDRPVFYTGDNRKFHHYTTNSRKLRCRIRDCDIWYDTRCSLRSFVLSRWWTLDGLRVLVQENTLFCAEISFYFYLTRYVDFMAKKL